MNHKVQNVQGLYESASTLYRMHVVGGGDASADSILSNLNQGIENLKMNWKGKDAGVQIHNVIIVYNAMVAVRNALAQLAVDSSKVASNYREIQNANGAGLESLSFLSFDAKTILSDYSDMSDTIDINPDVNTGKARIDAANNSIDAFINNVRVVYSEIMNNWTMGTGREAASEAFDSFINSSGNYKQRLSEVSASITTALQNYTF